MKKILFLIHSLGVGGAQRQLIVTAKGLAARGHDVIVVTFYSDGGQEDELTKQGVRIVSLNKRRRWELFRFYRRLVSTIRTESPDVVYSFLGGANVFAALAKPFARKPVYIWGIRSSNWNIISYPIAVRFSFWIESRLARFPGSIIANSNAGLEFSVQRGFPRHTLHVVANGIDTDRFGPNDEAGLRTRVALGLNANHTLFGIVARLDQIKGHAIFLQAAASVSRRNPNAQFIIVGGGDPDLKRSLQHLATDLGLNGQLHWSDFQSDMKSMYNAIDVVVSASLSEGFPNVIAEAMACGTPCIATDVGDSTVIIGASGVICRPKSSEALSEAMQHILDLPSARLAELSRTARNRIEGEYGISSMLDKTEEIFLRTMNHASSTRTSNHEVRP